jgi:hypothetical protein
MAGERDWLGRFDLCSRCTVNQLLALWSFVSGQRLPWRKGTQNIRLWPVGTPIKYANLNLPVQHHRWGPTWCLKIILQVRYQNSTHFHVESTIGIEPLSVWQSTRNSWSTEYILHARFYVVWQFFLTVFYLTKLSKTLCLVHLTSTWFTDDCRRTTCDRHFRGGRKGAKMTIDTSPRTRATSWSHNLTTQDIVLGRRRILTCSTNSIATSITREELMLYYHKKIFSMKPIPTSTV